MADRAAAGAQAGRRNLSRTAALTLYVAKQSESEDMMHESKSNGNINVRRPSTGRLPPWVYRLLVGLVAWFALSAWIFAGPGPANYLLFIVSGFMVVVVLLQLILSRVGRADDPAGSAEDGPQFRDRRKWDLDIFQSRISFNHAAVQILLPIGAAALGMTAIGIAMHVAEHASL